MYAMQTIRLRVNDKVYKNLIRLLSKFSKEEIQVIEENDTYLSIQQYLEKELTSVEDGSAEYTSIEELENRLDATIRKNEA
jgi:tyrosyl-tRNA synthetase